jgi:hypothetical protein
MVSFNGLRDGFESSHVGLTRPGIAELQFSAMGNLNTDIQNINLITI